MAGVIESDDEVHQDEWAPRGAPQGIRRPRSGRGGSRSRDYVGTLNNYQAVPGSVPEEPWLFWSVYEWCEQVSYFIAQQEVAPGTGTRHLQFFVQFKNAKSMSAVHKLSGLEHAALFPRRGSPEQAQEYCRKVDSKDPDGVGVFEYGTLVRTGEGQGSRTDWDLVHSLAQRGADTREFLEEVPHLGYVHISKIPAWIGAHDQRTRAWHTRPIIFFGPTRAGKSTRMERMTAGQKVYEKTDADKWWDGYDGEPVVTIDEMHGGYFQWQQLLKFFERGKYRVQYKGGSRQFLGEVCYMTCNTHPAFWYKDKPWDGSNAFRARIQEFGELWVFKDRERGPDGSWVYHEPVRDVELAQPRSETVEMFDRNVLEFGPPN